MASKSKAKAHILAVPFPSQGFINAMMHLCKFLANEGFTITVATIDGIHHSMKTNWSPKSNHDIRLHPLAFNWPHHVPHGIDPHVMDSNTLPFFLAKSEEPFQKELEDLVQTSTPKISLILSDHFMSVTAKVAAKLNLERVVLFPGSSAWSVLEYSAPLVDEKGHLPPEGDGRVDYIQGLDPLSLSDLPFYWHYDYGGPAWIETILERSPTIKNAAWVLVNSFYSLEPKSIDFMRSELGQKYVPVAPLLHLDQHDDGKIGISTRPQCEKSIGWLDAQKPGSVLYISFGALKCLPDHEFEELCAGIEASNVPFLWSIRPEHLSHKSKEIYTNFSNRMADKGRFASWVPQTKVLDHPSVGAFLTEGGWNSVLESIYSGVPLLTWPFIVENNLNAKFICEDWKIGLRLKEKSGENVDRNKVQKLVKEIFGEGGREVKENVKLLQLEARKSITEKADYTSSLSNIHQFLDYLENLG